MGVSMRDVLNFDIMNEAVVHTGETELDQRDIEWISVIEIPVENFVRKHEFVLSTGIGCEDHPSIFRSFVQDIIDSGATALMIATGRYVSNIPQEVLKLAQEHDFTLIEVSWQTRFSDIIHRVIQLINEENESNRNRVEALRQALVTSVLNGCTLEELMNQLYHAIEIPVAISDDEKNIRANCDFDADVIAALNGERDIAVERLARPDLPLTEHPLYHHLNQYLVGEKTCYELTIFSNNKKQGYLLVMPKSAEELNWFTMHALEHGLTACALYFLTENAVEKTEIRLKDNFVLQLAKDDTALDAKMLSKGELLGYDLTLPYACIVGDFQLKEIETDWDDHYDQPGQSSLHSLNYYVQKEITHASQQLERKTMSSFDEGEVIIFLEIDHSGYQETVNHFLDMVERRLHDQLAHVYFAWGIGLHANGMRAFYESYQEARTALDIHTDEAGFGDRTFFEETKVNRLLMNVADNEALIDMVRETVNPLIEYDRKRQTDLIHTFMTYQKFKGNVSQTSRALNLHRQSLLYRLRNIEQLTGLTLVDADDSFMLELSVRLWLLKQFK
ncbi:PucR family transcriptional regulator [Alkalibacillus almallahensis]|uniref:PucR family transcriptional regulator n=1 Tax=Alkalibacillus almallahensis TaxID=1379154 RepID=UPI00141E2D58|nr:PucR family transcriptional regulator [Alkalibacillus almallahensis]NIK13280.1 purine catabolism regulator [Alkalibacillus almallahensis]